MSITRISLYRHELEVIAKLTVDLARLDIIDHESAKDVSVMGPAIFARLVDALYGTSHPMISAESMVPKTQADGKPWDYRPGAVNVVNL
jgi:hypothetical protein